MGFPYFITSAVLEQVYISLRDCMGEVVDGGVSLNEWGLYRFGIYFLVSFGFDKTRKSDRHHPRVK